jgi:zinc protease
LRKFVKNIKTDDICSFIKNRLAKDRIYIGIAGNISETEAENLIDNVFGNLPEQSQTKALPAEDIKYAALGQTIIEDNTPQVLFEAVAPSVPRLSKDFYPLYIANYILGGAGLNSRLNQAAREKEGLTYGVYTGMELLKHAPQLVGSFSTNF